MNLKKIGLALAASALVLFGQRLRAVFRKKSESRAASADGNHGSSKSFR